jgi:hypothetical protein
MMLINRATAAYQNFIWVTGWWAISQSIFEHELSVAIDRVRISVAGMVGRRGLSAGLSALDADDRRSQLAQE